jgi:peptide/nickel transport system permease protein
MALGFILLLGLPLGILSGMFNRSRVSQFGRHLSTLLMSTPNFVLGAVFVCVFSVYALELKAGGWVPISESVNENLRHAILPAFTLSITGLGLLLAITRGVPPSGGPV